MWIVRCLVSLPGLFCYIMLIKTFYCHGFHFTASPWYNIKIINSQYNVQAGIRYMPHCILSLSAFLIQTKIFSSHFPERTRITIPYQNLKIIPRIAEARITILQHNDNIKTIFVKTKYRPIRFMLRYTL